MKSQLNILVVPAQPSLCGQRHCDRASLGLMSTLEARRGHGTGLTAHLVTWKGGDSTPEEKGFS